MFMKTLVISSQLESFKIMVFFHLGLSGIVVGHPFDTVKVRRKMLTKCTSMSNQRKFIEQYTKVIIKSNTCRH